MFKRIGIFLVPALFLAFSANARDVRWGLAAYERNDYTAALKQFRPLARLGHPLAQYYVGRLYEYGRGVERDFSEAAKWYGRAAKQGHAEAKLHLDFIYLTGRLERRNASPARMMNRVDVFRTEPKAARKDFRIQLGAVRSKIRAMKEAKRLARIYGAELGNTKINLVPAHLGQRGTYYRLRVGPIYDYASAEAVCRKIETRNQGCIVVRN